MADRTIPPRRMIIRQDGRQPYVHPHLVPHPPRRAYAAPDPSARFGGETHGRALCGSTTGYGAATTTHRHTHEKECAT